MCLTIYALLVFISFRGLMSPATGSVTSTLKCLREILPIDLIYVLAHSN